MSQTNNGQVNGHANGHVNGVQNLNADNLAQVPPVDKDEIGLPRYLGSPCESDPYYLPPREQDRKDHERRLQEQSASVERLLN